MINSSVNLQIKTGNYDVLFSGVVHLWTEEIEFKLEDLKIKFAFKSDSSGARLTYDIINDKELQVNLFNFSNSLGEGKIEPIELGTIKGKKLSVSFFVNSVENNLRQFNYTFYTKED